MFLSTIIYTNTYFVIKLQFNQVQNKNSTNFYNKSFMYKITKQQIKNHKHEEVQRWFKIQIKQVIMNL
jgi:hypothetical protein